MSLFIFSLERGEERFIFCNVNKVVIIQGLSATLTPYKEWYTPYFQYGVGYVKNGLTKRGAWPNL